LPWTSFLSGLRDQFAPLALEAQSFGDKAGINRLFTGNRKKTGWIAADVNYAD
jgi:hypothetical protein